MDKADLLRYLGYESFTSAASNATRLVSKLKSSIEREELYETHQILRTIYFRFVNVKEKLEPLCGLLYHGSLYLLESNEMVSGQDIAMIFLEAGAKRLRIYRDEGGEEAKFNLACSSRNHHTQNDTIDHDISQRAANLARELPDNEIGQSKFIAESFKILSPKLLNHSLLHENLAWSFRFPNKRFDKKNYARLRYHFLHCANIENTFYLTDILVEYQTKCAFKSEADLFLTQFILQYLCLQAPKDPPKSQPSHQSENTNSIPPITNQTTRESIQITAEKVFSQYTLLNNDLDSTFPSPLFPLLNFTYFIISIIDAPQEATTFRMLCDIYKITWSRDPNFQSYLDRIGTIYFGIQNQSKPHQGGFLNNILLSLLEGTDEDEDSTQDENHLSSCDELD